MVASELVLVSATAMFAVLGAEAAAEVDLLESPARTGSCPGRDVAVQSLLAAFGLAWVAGPVV